MTQLHSDISVYLVDDDDVLRTALAQMFELEDINVIPIAKPREFSQSITPEFEGIVVTDVRMPDMDGFELFERIKVVDADIPVTFITGHADVPMVLSSLRDGAFDFFAKPADSEQLLASARRAIEFRKLVLENRKLKTLAARAVAGSEFIGESAAIQKLRDTIHQVAPTDLDILIEGESGTGKNLVAGLVHQLSGRARRDLVTVNCAALPSSGAEEELFGYMTNPHSLSAREQIGAIESANEGTLFLDKLEILPMRLQGQLLPVIERRQITIVNGDEPKDLDLRVIASAGTDLSEAASAGVFQTDLLYRLNAVRLRLPPLRERKEDIPLLFSHFVTEAAQRHNKKIPKMTAGTRQRLVHYDWPGNVRELKNFADSIVLGISALGDKSASSELSLPERVEKFESNIIRAALEQAKGDSKAAITALGIPRKTFYDKVSRHGIDLKSYRKRAS